TLQCVRWSTASAAAALLSTLLSIARGALAEDARLPAQATLEAALAEAVRASCPETRFSIDPALSRAAQLFAAAVEEGRASPSGSALGFYASLESAEPAPVSGVATIEPASNADRAVGDLFSRSCRFNRAGVAAGRYGRGAVVALLTARHETELSPIPGRVEAGEEVMVHGRLPRGLKSPRLFL